MLQLYRVVESRWVGGQRVEKDIGCGWKPERRAKEEMKALQLKSSVVTYSIQRKEK